MRRNDLKKFKLLNEKHRTNYVEDIILSDLEFRNIHELDYPLNSSILYTQELNKNIIVITISFNI